MRRWIAMLAVVFLAGPVAFGQATQPARVSDAAKAVMDSMREGYSKLKTLDVAGTVKVNLDAAGEKENREGSFNATFQAPANFRHEMKDDMLIVNNGEKAYLFKIDQKMYATVDAVKEKGELDKLPDPIASQLQQQNPSVLMALVPDAGKGLTEGVDSVERGEDVTLDGTAYQVLVLKSGGQEIRAAVHPKTGLLRQMTVDLKGYLQSRSVPNVNAAMITIDYSKSLTDGPVEVAGFAWAPPEDARLVKLPEPDARAGGPGGDAIALIGKDAPAFTLKDMDDKSVSLGDLKGSVVVLDFWATWCGPCVQAMPHLAKIHSDLSPKGLKVYAVNLREPPALIKTFLEEQKLSLPVLLDAEAKTAESYMVTGIPQTVIVGKDGKVARVFVGFGPGGEEELRKAVEAAMQ